MLKEQKKDTQTEYRGFKITNDNCSREVFEDYVNALYELMITQTAFLPGDFELTDKYCDDPDFRETVNSAMLGIIRRF